MMNLEIYQKNIEDDYISIVLDGKDCEIASMVYFAICKEDRLASIMLTACIKYLSEDAADASHFKSLLDKAVKDNINLN